ncbi:DNA-binding transcription factor [Lithospermum erythrorhizon]|uniref:DNA-binding transcription factor n=1 Tax=Lithospermum erythrorhizon TaxID=34254 RepID=A0AAV3Q4M2_LITER
MAKATHNLPLYELKFRNNEISRTIELIILFLLLSLVGYRIIKLKDNGYPWLLALVCESWFTINWIIIVSTKWNQLITKTYPERLLKWRSSELPEVDMFVTTADPELEPPIMTVNTVLSLLATEYPAHKLACYVSDDAASPLTFYSLVEAIKFAKYWVPFCKKYNVSVRAPFRYFKPDSQPCSNASSHDEFLQDWMKIKEEYAKLYLKIEDACKKTEPCDLSGDYSDFSNINRRNHKSIVKVIHENKEAVSEGVPHLIYVAREKRPKYSHNNKAGAMNVLNRVSGLMTNAPIMLNVDCDMYANNPLVILQAMCFLFSDGGNNQKDYAFVQFPQHFYDGLKDDPYGNQLKVLHEFLGRGISGIQGPFYQGTGCFHRRNVIYGSSPDDKFIEGIQLSNENLQSTFGNSRELCESAAKVLQAKELMVGGSTSTITNSVEAACQVANCAYEFGTGWGRKVGWMYGSVTEDILTGLTIHARGWETAYCTPDPPGFLGCTPSNGPVIILQFKRWSTGLFEILFSSKSPLISTLTKKLRLRQCLAYLWIQLWALRSIFEVCYAILPAYCIISNSSHFLPKINEPATMIPISIMVIYKLYTLSEYIRAGQSIRAWWNNQRMWKVLATSSWLFGILSVGLKVVGLSETAFEVTKKDNGENDESNSDKGRFTFDESPMFIPGTFILLLNLTALLVFAFRTIYGNHENMMYLGEIICCKMVVIYFWAFFKGLFGRGNYGIPLPTIIKSGTLVLFVCAICIRGE